MSEHTQELTDATFSETIATGVTLVDFWAPWCGPCRMQGPIVDKVAEQLDGKATIAKLNVDDGAESAGQFGIRSIPTLIVFKDGEAVQTFVGVQSEATLKRAVEQALA